MILACDIATTSGFAWGAVGETPQWEAVHFKGKDTGEVLSRLRFYLTEKVTLLKPSRICLEAPYIPTPRAPRIVRAGTAVANGLSGPPPMNPHTLRRLLAMCGLVEEIAFERKIECREATIQEITSYFTGTTRHGGRANKKAATIAACRRLGWETVSDDAADALALWSFCEFILAPEIASRRLAGASIELPLHGTLAAPTQQRIGRRVTS